VSARGRRGRGRGGGGDVRVLGGVERLETSDRTYKDIKVTNLPTNTSYSSSHFPYEYADIE